MKQINFIKYAIILSMLFTTTVTVYAQSEDADAVLKKVDVTQKNYKTFTFNAVMNIQSGSRKLIKNFSGNIETATDSAFMEYTNPQDYGTKYLKLDDNLWIYLPDAQDVVKISGHLLRDSIMGSDISYDDIMDQGSYSVNYTADSLTSVDLDGKDTYILTIRAIDPNDVSYIKQDLYVNKTTYYIEKIILYAKGRSKDRAIKEFVLKNYITIGKFAMPQIFEARDLRKKNSSTIVKYNNIKVDVPINKKMFTRSYLEN